MERLALIMSHADRSMGGAVRELHFCAGLRRLGVDARVWRMHAGRETEREEMLGVPVSFVPSDVPEEHVHRQVSAVLRAEIAAFRPEMVLHKGLSYRVSADVQASRPEGARYGLIVGGSTVDPLVAGASVIFGEYDEQLRTHFRDHRVAGRTMVLPKWVDLERAGPGRPPQDAEFDIVNVGTFAEPRKNQQALVPFAARHRIAFVGGGPLMAPVRQAVKLAGNADRARFFGRLQHAEVFEVLKKSLLMVHTSTHDGLPRATIEAMACGLPVVAFRRTVLGGFGSGSGLLVSEAGLPHAVELLLADHELRQQMGRAARRHIENRHGGPALARAAEEALALFRRF
jgi:glycosyltransferase involved in cell wall biosynthesis